jgi:hypothetical protein
MFLKLLNEESQKEFFLNLAYLVALSDGDMRKNSGLASMLLESASEGPIGDMFGRVLGGGSLVGALGGALGAVSQLSNQLKPELEKQRSRIDDSEINMMKAFIFEMDCMKNIDDIESGCLKNNLNAWIRKSRGGVSQSADAKKIIMISLVEKDIDITTLGQDDIENEFMNNSETRRMIFSKAGSLAVQNIDVNFTTTQKKAVIFELVGMAYANGEFSETELATVKSISEGFDIDEETFEEICRFVDKLNQLSAESLELIQE